MRGKEIGELYTDVCKQAEIGEYILRRFRNPFGVQNNHAQCYSERIDFRFNKVRL